MSRRRRPRRRRSRPPPPSARPDPPCLRRSPCCVRRALFPPSGGASQGPRRSIQKHIGGGRPGVLMPRCPGPQIARPSSPGRERDRRLGSLFCGARRATEHPRHTPPAGSLLRRLDCGCKGVDDRLVPHLGLATLLYAAEGGFEHLGGDFRGDFFHARERFRGFQEGGAVERAGRTSDLAYEGHGYDFEHVGGGRRFGAFQTFERRLEASVHVVAVVTVPDLRVELRQVPPVLFHGGGHLPYHVLGGLRRVQVLLLRLYEFIPYPVLEHLPEGVAR